MGRFRDILVNFLVFFYFVLPMTVRMYGMIVLLIQVHLIIFSIFFLVFGLICFIIEHYDSNYRQVRQGYTEAAESVFDVIFIIGSSIVITNIVIISLAQLYSADIINTFNFDLGINVTGNQWYWTYSYKDSFNYFLRFNYCYYSDKKIKESENLIINIISNLSLVVNFNRLLICDYALYIPVDSWVGANIQSKDVIHSWALPNFGIKQDAIPGRQSLQVFRSEIIGVTFGQCSELCGTNHAFMPVNIFISHQEIFLVWYGTMVGVPNKDSSYSFLLYNVINFENLIIEDDINSISNGNFFNFVCLTIYFTVKIVVYLLYTVNEDDLADLVTENLNTPLVDLVTENSNTPPVYYPVYHCHCCPNFNVEDIEKYKDYHRYCDHEGHLHCSCSGKINEDPFEYLDKNYYN